MWDGSGLIQALAFAAIIVVLTAVAIGYGIAQLFN
jgi:hypothetical protein